MENNALITMSGRQEVDGELDRYELTTLGSYVRKGDKYYVSYIGSEITGYEDTRTTLKIKEDYVSMIRFGDSPTQMVFEKGNCSTGYYETPFGALSVGVTTNSMSVDMNDDGGEVKLDYFVQLNGSAPVRNGLHLQIRKVGNTGDSI